MSAHTPGPWEARWFEKNKRTHTGEWYFVATSPPGFGWGQKVSLTNRGLEGQANARLIAAAPDLLAALEAISRAGTLNDQAVIDQMVAALAKARGGR